MKKNIIFYACAAAALVFASCQKETPATEGPQTPSTGLDVITATTVSTKTTTQDGVTVLWENGDQIGLWVGGSDRTESAIYTATMEQPNSSASFVRTEEPAPGSYENKMFALYPASSLNKWASKMDNPTNSRVYVNLPQSQTAVAGAWDKNAGILASSSTTSEFQFNHIMSYLKFTVDASSTPFVSLKVMANDGKYLSGENIGVLYGEQIAYDPGYTSGTYYPNVTLANSDNAVFAPGTYYIAILPGTFTKGFTFTFEDADGKTAKKELVKEVAFEAGDVANIGTIGTLQFVEPLELCSVYEENGVKQGVVFWVDPENPLKGKIISLKSLTTKWSKEAPAGDVVTENLRFTSDDPLENHDAVTALDDYCQENYPAVYFCDEMRSTSGGNWHLPNLQELADFASTYYNKSLNTTTASNLTTDTDAESAAASFDTIVENAGGTKFTGIVTGYQYWTGKEKIGGGKIKICAPRFGNYSPGMSLEHTTDNGIARCIRDVELQ